MSRVQSEKMDMLSQILYKEADDKVLPVKQKPKKQELVVLQKWTDPSYCEVLRGQVYHLNNQLKRKHDDMELIGKISTYKNPVNLFNRFGEYVKDNGDGRFEKTNNKVLLKNGSTVDDLMTTLRRLEDDKHDTAKKVSDLL